MKCKHCKCLWTKASDKKYTNIALKRCLLHLYAQHCSSVVSVFSVALESKRGWCTYKSTGRGGRDQSHFGKPWPSHMSYSCLHTHTLEHMSTCCASSGSTKPWSPCYRGERSWMTWCRGPSSWETPPKPSTRLWVLTARWSASQPFISCDLNQRWTVQCN